jgi:hypothetical protein
MHRPLSVAVRDGPSSTGLSPGFTGSLFRTIGPASTSWTAPTGSREVVKSHFG